MGVGGVGVDGVGVDGVRVDGVRVDSVCVCVCDILLKFSYFFVHIIGLVRQLFCFFTHSYVCF